MEYNYVSYDDIPLIMTVEDLMPILLIGRSTAYKLVRSGKLKTFRVEKQIRISRDALIEYIKQEQQRHDT
jgi:excisionase family DNA binding protein